MPTARVADINIYYEVHGEGEPLLLIMGYGANSQWWYLQVPAFSQEYKVISLVLGCTTPGGHNTILPDQETLDFLLDHERRSSLPLEEHARELLPFLFSQEFLDKNQAHADHFMSQAFERITPTHGYQRQGEAFMSFNVWDRLPKIKVPTLVMTGTADRLIPAENSRLLASRIPDAKLILYENVGHSFTGEVEEEANRAVLDFVGRHSRAPV